MAQWVNRLQNNIFVNSPLVHYLLGVKFLEPYNATGFYSWLAGRRNTGKFRKFQNGMHGYRLKY